MSNSHVIDHVGLSVSDYKKARRFYDAALIQPLLETTGTPGSQLDINSIALSLAADDEGDDADPPEPAP